MSKIPPAARSKITKAVRNVIHLSDGSKFKVRGLSKGVAKSDMAAIFKVGKTKNLVGKSDEYMRQLRRQIDGLNNMTAADLLDNMQTVTRGGLKQKQAREQYRRELVEGKARLHIDDGVPLNEALARAEQEADDLMATLAALHEPDIVAGGKDVISFENGLPSLGDTFVNSSLGSQWRNNRAALEQIAREMIATGRGAEKMNIGFVLG